MRRLKGERGASAVEFAIIASLLLMILFGTITFGFVFNRFQGLQASGREGARLGSLSTTTRQEIVDRVKQSVSIIQGSSIAVDCAQNPPTSLLIETGCVDVFVRHNASAACPPAAGGSCTEYTTASQKPCGDNIPSGATDPAVIVQVFYRLRIDIPLWASPQMTISGAGEFRCEQ